MYDHDRRRHGAAHHAHGGQKTGAEHLVKDPVCGMWVDPHATKQRAERNGQPYYFCSAGCREKFLADPAHYVDASKVETVPAATVCRFWMGLVLSAPVMALEMGGHLTSLDHLISQ